MDKLNPGSDAAIKAGCQCPVYDNGKGRGYMGQEGIFVYSGGCPVHADEYAEIERKHQERMKPTN